MVVPLGDGVAMAAVVLPAFLVGGQDFLVGSGMVDLHPGKQGGTEIEVEELVIVGDALDAAASQVEDPGEGVGPVALVINPFVPVGERLGAGLVVNDPRPGVFPGGLVKMSMDDQGSRHDSSAL